MTQHKSPQPSAFKYVLSIARCTLALFIVFLLISGQSSVSRAHKRDSTTEAGSHPLEATQEDGDARTLEQGKPIERELKGGEVHSYKISLTPGLLLHIVVDQRGIDIVAALFGPDNAKVIEVDSPNGARGPEPLSLVTEAAGSYRLEVRSLEKADAAGKYEARIEEMRPATAKDRQMMSAQTLLAEATELVAQRKAPSLLKAIDKFEAALLLLRDLKDSRREADTLSTLGNLYFRTGKRPKAFETHNQALAIWRTIGDLISQAETLNDLGLLYNVTGENQKALDHYEQSIKILHDLGDRRREAVALHNAGKVYSVTGDNEKALDYFNRALVLVRSINDKRGEGYNLSSIGATFSNMSEFRKALDYFNQALVLRRSTADRPGEGTTLNDMGVAYQNLGETQKSIEFFQQSLRIREEVGDRSGQGEALNNISLSYNLIGESQKAIEVLNKALAIFSSLGYRQGEAVATNNLGGIHSELGDKTQALDYYAKALTLYRTAGNRAGEATALNNIGALYFDLGDKQKAIDYYNQALPIQRAAKDRESEACTLINLGLVYTSMGDTQKAFEHYGQALQIDREVGSKHGEATVLHNLGKIYSRQGDREKALIHFNQVVALSRVTSSRRQEADALYAIADIERSRGNLAEARTRIEAAINIVESVRTKVLSQDLRATFFASVQKYYELYIDLLMLLHKKRPSENSHATALQASERARARSLLDLLAESRADIRQGVAPELLVQERSLQQQLSIKADRQTRLLAGKHTQQQADVVAKELEGLTSEYRNLLAQIRATSPRYAALTQPVPLTLGEIQDLVLEPGSLLLEYALGEERSYLWVVTKDSLTTYELPKRATIEEAARKVYSALATRHRQLAQDATIQRDLSVSESAKSYQQAAESLSRMILEPAAAHLKNRRLVIVADGALQYVPFAALPEPEAKGSRVGRRRGAKEKNNEPPTPGLRRPLIVKHEIVTLPSASSLAALRKETKGRTPAEKLVAVLADPVFTNDDARLKAVPAQKENPAAAMDNRALRSTAVDVGLGGSEFHIPRLPGTRREAEQILNLAPAAERMQALDFAASRTTAVSDKLREYRYLHFATHGFLNSVHPELSGIVLSMFDEKGVQQNGFLRVHEIFNLDLPVELVVLSACQTGLGKEVKGEGLVGLTRGFMYAGSPRVVVSLWSVSDVATAELMARFYRSMLKENLRPAAALRAAQIQMLRQKRWQEPFYWAAFTLQGEWR